MAASILAWPGAIAIGVSLGLLGSGGSIITVPVLVYLIGQDEKVAIAGSLFVVGDIALAGSLQYVRAKLIDWRNVFIFGVPGMAGTYLGAVIAAWAGKYIYVSDRDQPSGEETQHPVTTQIGQSGYVTDIMAAGHSLVADEPPSMGGTDLGPAPYDLFMASIATCAGFYVQAYCESRGIDSSGIDITLSAKRDSKTKKIAGFVTTIYLPPELPEKLHAALKKVAEQCAVKTTIMSNPDFVVHTVSRAD